MTEQIRQIAHLITGRQTSDGAGVKLKRVFRFSLNKARELLFS